MACGRISSTSMFKMRQILTLQLRLTILVIRNKSLLKSFCHGMMFEVQRSFVTRFWNKSSRLKNPRNLSFYSINVSLRHPFWEGFFLERISSQILYNQTAAKHPGYSQKYPASYCYVVFGVLRVDECEVVRVPV